jgi:hypothetical protein
MRNRRWVQRLAVVKGCGLFDGCRPLLEIVCDYDWMDMFAESLPLTNYHRINTSFKLQESSATRDRTIDSLLTVSGSWSMRCRCRWSEYLDSRSAVCHCRAFIWTCYTDDEMERLYWS